MAALIRTPHPVLLLALVLRALSGVGPVAAQELGPLYLQGISSHPELPNAHGAGLVLGVEPVPGWLVEGSYQRISQDTNKAGMVCVVYEPRMSCGEEAVHTSSELGGTRVSVQRTVNLGEHFRLGVGAGGSFTSVKARSRGESGRKADLNAPKTGQLGGMMLVSTRVRLSESIPVAMVGSLSNHWVAFKACATNPYTYDPYCGVSSFKEFGLGFVFLF